MKLAPRSCWFLSVALFAPLVAAPAAAQPGDGEFRVNTTSPTKQRESVAAFSPDGGSTVVWRDLRAGLTARFFPAGRTPSEDVVLVDNRIFDQSPATGTIFSRRSPAIHYLDNGDFYLFWTEDKSFLSVAPFYENYTVIDEDVLGQRFNARGQAVGHRFRVHRSQRGLQRNPSVAPARGGGFLVVWETADGVAGVGPDDGVYARLFNARGAAVGPEVELDELQGVDARVPKLAAGTDGGFLAVWQGEGDGTDDYEVYARLLDADGVPEGSQMQLNSGAHTRDQGAPAVAAGADGDYLVTWFSPVGEPPGVVYRVFGQVVGADGALLGPETQLTDHEVERAHALPEVAASPRGGYLLAWLYWFGDFQTGVAGVHLDAQANALGEPFLISEHQTSSRSVSIAAGPNGDFMATWEGFTDDENLNVAARRIPGPDVEEPAAAPLVLKAGPVAIGTP